MARHRSNGTSSTSTPRETSPQGDSSGGEGESNRGRDLVDVMTKSAWLHIQDALAINRLAFFAGSYKVGEGTRTQVTAYLDIADAQVVFGDIALRGDLPESLYPGRKVEFLGGSPARKLARVISVQFDPKLRSPFVIAVSQGPGKIAETGGIAPEDWKQMETVKLFLTVPQARKLATQVVQVVNAWVASGGPLQVGEVAPAVRGEGVPQDTPVLVSTVLDLVERFVTLGYTPHEMRDRVGLAAKKLNVGVDGMTQGATVRWIEHLDELIARKVKQAHPEPGEDQPPAPERPQAPPAPAPSDPGVDTGGGGSAPPTPQPASQGEDPGERPFVVLPRQWVDRLLEASIAAYGEFTEDDELAACDWVTQGRAAIFTQLEIPEAERLLARFQVDDYGLTLYGDAWGTTMTEMVEALTEGRTTTPDDCTREELITAARGLEIQIKRQQKRARV